MVFDQKVAIAVLAAVIAYVAYRIFFSSKDASLTRYEQEVEEILTSDKYKVKGRFEE
ncbi:hypothetical protein HYV83_05655 [Candidatus Woesearchaeota archaeon]|nr:hypothetical protein [Candidatus Woesearchaeota archaeon]